MALTGLGYFQNWKERVGGWCGFTVTGAAILVGPGERERLERNVAMLRRVGVDTEAVTPGGPGRRAPRAGPGRGRDGRRRAPAPATPTRWPRPSPSPRGRSTWGRGSARGWRCGAGRGRRPGGRGRHRRRPGRGRRGRAGLRALGRPAGPDSRFELGITPERSQIAFFRRPGAAHRHPVVIDGVLGSLLPAPWGRADPARGGGRPPYRGGGDRARGRGLRPRGDRRGPWPAGRAGAGVRGGAVRPRPPRGLRHLGRQPGRARRRPRGGRAVCGRRLLGHRVQEVPGRRDLHGRAGHPGPATTVDLHPFRLGRFAEGDPIVGDEYRLPPEFGHKL